MLLLFGNVVEEVANGDEPNVLGVAAVVGLFQLLLVAVDTFGDGANGLGLLVANMGGLAMFPAAAAAAAVKLLLLPLLLLTLLLTPNVD